jgi:hypothetical protein
MAKAGIGCSLGMRGRVGGIVVALSLSSPAAHPVFASELKEDRPEALAKADVPATEYDCENEGKYFRLHPFKRGNKIVWLRCGRAGKGGWGYLHIVGKHEWGPVPKYATGLTYKKGKKIAQDQKGSFRYEKNVENDVTDETMEWVVVVQHTKTWKGEPGPKGIITSFRKG